MCDTSGHRAFINARPSCVHKRNYGTLHPFKLFVGQRPAQMDNNNIFVRVGRSVRLTESRHFSDAKKIVSVSNTFSNWVYIRRIENRTFAIFHDIHNMTFRYRDGNHLYRFRNILLFPSYFPLIASITCANRLSGTLANVIPGLVSVSILPVNSWMCLLDHSPGARLHNAKIIAVGFGAAFLWTVFFFVTVSFPSFPVAVSVVISSHS